MKIPLELEHLIRTAVDAPSASNAKLAAKLAAKGPKPELPDQPKAKPTSLSECMAIIDSRKALEVEHYLRACALRLDIVDGLTGLGGLGVVLND